MSEPRVFEELRQKTLDLEQFAYAASHDLQEPLRVVSNYATLLVESIERPTEEQEFFAKMITDSTSRMQALIGDLLKYSRVGSFVDMQPVSSKDAFFDALDSLRMAREEAGATIVMDNPMPIVHADKTLLTQLLQNLIANAIKFRNGRKPEIHVGCEGTGDKWRMYVDDNGIGVDPRFADRIFKVFQRLHPQGEYQGTGIGLAICKRICDRHGWSISVARSASGGARFSFGP